MENSSILPKITLLAQYSSHLTGMLLKKLDSLNNKGHYKRIGKLGLALQSSNDQLLVITNISEASIQNKNNVPKRVIDTSKPTQYPIKSLDNFLHNNNIFERKPGLHLGSARGVKKEGNIGFANQYKQNEWLPIWDKGLARVNEAVEMSRHIEVLERHNLLTNGNITGESGRGVLSLQYPEIRKIYQVNEQEIPPVRKTINSYTGKTPNRDMPKGDFSYIDNWIKDFSKGLNWIVPNSEGGIGKTNSTYSTLSDKVELINEPLRKHKINTIDSPSKIESLWNPGFQLINPKTSNNFFSTENGKPKVEKNRLNVDAAKGRKYRGEKLDHSQGGRTIQINLNRAMIENFTIHTSNVKEGLSDFKSKVEEVLLEILSNANAIQ